MNFLSKFIFALFFRAPPLRTRLKNGSQLKKIFIRIDSNLSVSRRNQSRSEALPASRAISRPMIGLFENMQNFVLKISHFLKKTLCHGTLFPGPFYKNACGQNPVPPLISEKTHLPIGRAIKS